MHSQAMYVPNALSGHNRFTNLPLNGWIFLFSQERIKARAVAPSTGNAVYPKTTKDNSVTPVTRYQGIFHLIHKKLQFEVSRDFSR
jgi:hypothetical protein